ncbi:MAG: hypothetical protein WCK10_00730, partial [Candidatus Staskawiczbacteria bacterium]
MTDIKDQQEKIEALEKKTPDNEQTVNLSPEREVTLEGKELLRDDKAVTAELRREIEMMQLDDNTKKDAEAKAEKIEFLGEKEKIEHLLQTAREKGLVFAIHVARKMNEPYLLDVLHDTLADEGYYKDFINKKNITDDDSDN